MVICDILARNCFYHLFPTFYSVFQKFYSGWARPRRNWLPSPHSPTTSQFQGNGFLLGKLPHSQLQDPGRRRCIPGGTAKKKGSHNSTQFILIGKKLSLGQTWQAKSWGQRGLGLPLLPSFLPSIHRAEVSCQLG